MNVLWRRHGIQLPRRDLVRPADVDGGRQVQLPHLQKFPPHSVVLHADHNPVSHDGVLLRSVQARSSQPSNVRQERVERLTDFLCSTIEHVPLIDDIDLTDAAMVECFDHFVDVSPVFVVGELPTDRVRLPRCRCRREKLPHASRPTRCLDLPLSRSSATDL